MLVLSITKNPGEGAIDDHGPEYDLCLGDKFYKGSRE